MSAHVTQEVHYKNGVYKTWTDRGFEHDSDNSYKNFILEQEVAASEGEFIVRTYKIPEGGPKALLDTWAHLNDHFPVTMAYSTSDTSFVAVCIIDGKGKKRRARKWGDLRSVAISMEPKIMKRLGMLGTKSYLNGKYKVRIVTENVYHPEEDVITVLVLPTPKSKEKEVDGSFWIRPRLFQDMYERALDRIGDADRRDCQAEAMMATACHNSRFILPGFTIKGDAEVAGVGIALNADVITFDCNLFNSVSTRGDYGLFMMTPHTQGGKVRTNRQTIAHFWDLLFGEDVRTPVFGPSLGLVKDAFIKEVNREIQAFEAGKLMSFVEPGARNEDDSIRTVQTKALHWVKAGLSLNESLYLLTALGQQRINMWTPSEEEEYDSKKRTRLPAPYARRYALRDMTSYRMVRRINRKMKRGEGFVDNRLGLIVNPHDWEDVLESCGGGDKDDSVEIHYRVTSKAFTFRGAKFKKDDIVLFIIRLPAGMASDGKKIASEYYILKPTKDYAAQIRKKFGKLPEMDPDKLPVHILDLKLPKSRQPARPSGMPVSYADPEEGKKYFRLTIEAASTAQLVYDKHSALMRNLRLLNIPFSSIDENGLAVKEEFFIDTCTQWRNPQDIKWIVKDTELKKELLPEDMPYTPIVELTIFHEMQVERFEKAAFSHVRKVKQSLEARFDGVSIPLKEGKAEVVLYNRIATQRYRNEYGIEGNLSFRDFEAIGSYTARRMLEIKPEPEVLQAIRDAYVWLTQETTGTNSEDISSMYTSTDSSLMAGGMFDLLLKAFTHG